MTTPFTHAYLPHAHSKPHVVMGRKKDLKELRQRGPGRKARKQKDPQLPASLSQEVEADKAKKKVGGHVSQRARKKAMKKTAQQLLKERKERRKSVTKARCEDGGTGDTEQEVDMEQGFSDRNKTWLKPTTRKRKMDAKEVEKGKRVKHGLLEGSDGSSDVDEGGEMHL